MKCIFVILFFVVMSFAQELDTTYVVNELGQTVGYIHEKGTSVTIVPVQSPVPVATQIPVFPAPVVVQRPAVAPAPVVPQVDTREKYLEDMRDLYYARGSQLKSRGNALLIGGAMGLAVGLATFIYAIEESEDEDDYYYDDDDDSDYAVMGITGYCLAIAGGALLTSGIITKIVASSKIRKARHFERTLNDYRFRKNLSDIRFTPTFNPKTGAVGGNLALNF